MIDAAIKGLVQDIGFVYYGPSPRQANLMHILCDYLSDMYHEFEDGIYKCLVEEKKFPHVANNSWFNEKQYINKKSDQGEIAYCLPPPIYSRLGMVSSCKVYSNYKQFKNMEWAILHGCMAYSKNLRYPLWFPDEMQHN